MLKLLLYVDDDEDCCIFAAGQFGPEGPPPQPPTAWQHALHAIGGVVNFFGRISFLVDENAHAFHFFISALLQLLDRSALPQSGLVNGSSKINCIGKFHPGYFRFH